LTELFIRGLASEKSTVSRFQGLTVLSSGQSFEIYNENHLQVTFPRRRHFSTFRLRAMRGEQAWQTEL